MVSKNFINGEWMTLSGKTFNKLNPCNGEILGQYPCSDVETVNYAIVKAKESFEHWKLTSRLIRADYFDNLAQIIKQRKEEIARIVSLETGKSINESKAEVIEALHMIQFTFGKARTPSGELIESEIAGKRIRVIRKPRGPTAVIAPWNFPFAIPFWCMAPAILEGNTVIFKPSEDSPMTGELIADLMKQAGFPDGVFNLVHGEGDTGKHLVEHKLIKTVLFTGSAAVGDWIQSQCVGGKICSCEMGSKSAIIVHKDANLNLAVSSAIPSFSKLSGQRCVSSSRIIVHENIFDAFVEAFIAKAKALTVGDPRQDKFDFGPVINENAFNRVKEYNEMIRKDAAKPHSGVKVLLDLEKTNFNKGLFLGPFVYTSPWTNAKYLHEEIFGPNVGIIPYKDDDLDDGISEACRIYNDTEFALAVGVITEGQRNQYLFEQQCDAGMIYFNAGSIAAESHTYFGGQKRSGNNRPSAAGTFDTVVDKVCVTENLNSSIQFPQGMK